MYRLLGSVSRNFYYGYCQRQVSRDSDFERDSMRKIIKKTAQATSSSYGSRGMKSVLNSLDYSVGCYKTRWLMRESRVKVRARKKYKVTSQNLQTASCLYFWYNQYLDTGKLAVFGVFITLFFRQVVGWSMDSRMKTMLVTKALWMAIGKRYPTSGLQKDCLPRMVLSAAWIVRGNCGEFLRKPKERNG